MSTSDDHDELSDSDFIDYPEHYDDDDDDPHRARSLAMLPIPDLRFEQSYLKSIKAFVHIEQTSVSNESRKLEGQEIGKDVTPIVDSSHQLVKIDWGKVVWVTFRDQIISPLFQGALWYAMFSFLRRLISRRCYAIDRGLASGFIRPFFSLIGSHIRGIFPHLPHNAMGELGWWKWWTHGLGLRSSSPGSGNGIGRR